MVDSLWVLIPLGVILVAYSLYLYGKYAGRPEPVRSLPPENCYYCGQPEAEDVFCPDCARRLSHKYLAVGLGVLAFPLGAGLGFAYAWLTDEPAADAIFFGIFGLIILYNLVVWPYLILYHPERVRIHIGGISADPTGMAFTFRGLRREYSLLRQQKQGRKKESLLQLESLRPPAPRAETEPSGSGRETS